MTDCSNPIVDHSRVRAGRLADVRAVRLRQDLKSLTVLCTGARRTLLPVEERVGWQASASEDLRTATDKLQAFKVDPGVFKPAETRLEKVGKFPVSGVRHGQENVHPNGINMCEGYASTVRLFGGGKRDCREVPGFLQVFEPEELAPAEEIIYTRGTGEGFATRIDKQVSRKCVSVYTNPFFTVSGRGMKAQPGRMESKYIQNVLQRTLPISGDLPNWEGDSLLDLIENVQVTARSSAGAPYWKDKCEAHEQMLSAVLPRLTQALLDNKVEELRRQEPEWFLCELKNKLDRYEVAKLGVKTRLYFAIPYHWSILFSVLCQSFTDCMELFHSSRSKDCANAYGLAWAHGGAELMRTWARKAEYKKLRFYCYGDDTDLYWRDKNRVLWRVSPDFTQMDGSVDKDCVKETVDYVYNCFAKQHGHSVFWRRVADWWVHFATNPDFLVHGDEVYRKPQEDGLVSGVVGTTLFDTAKAVISYTYVCDLVEQGAIPMEKLHDAEHMKKIFMELGFEIKDATWSPVRVNENYTMGELFADAKFLGVYLKYVPGPMKTELVPYLPDSDWIRLILNPRNLQERKRDNSSESYLSRQRTRFDRMRGYLVTGAFSNERVRSAIHANLNSIDPVAINMEVRADLGKGALPENPLLLGEGFHYHDSEGVPSEKWCQNLYFTDDNQWEDAPWLYIFPDIVSQLRSYKEAVAWNHPLLTQKVSSLRLVCQEADPTPLTLTAGLTTKRKVQGKEIEPLKMPEGGIKVHKPHSGTEAEQLKAFFDNRSHGIEGDMIGVPVAETLAHFNWRYNRLLSVAKETGYFVYDGWVCTKYVPLGVDSSTLAAQVEVAKRDKADRLVTKYSNGEDIILASVPPVKKPDVNVPIAVYWQGGAKLYLDHLREKLHKLDYVIKSPKSALKELEQFVFQGPTGGQFTVRPGTREVREDHAGKVARETTFYLRHVLEDGTDLAVQALFKIVSPLGSVNRMHASVLLYEHLVGPYLPKEPAAAPKQGANMAQKLLQAISRVAHEEGPMFAMGPIAPPPEFRDWYESTRVDDKYNTYRVVVAQTEIPPNEELLPVIAREANYLEKTQGTSIYPLEVVILSERGRRRISVGPKGSVVRSSKLETIRNQEYKHEEPKQEQQTEQSYPRACSPSSETGEGTRRKARNRSTGTASTARKKKWKANKKQRLAADAAGRRPSGPGDAGAQRPPEKSACDRGRQAPLY